MLRINPFHLFWIIGLLLLFTFCKDSGSSQTSQPNIIYILADDLGYGELGSYGQTKIKTPHLDQLAREGMRFTQHYTGAPVCAPARCILLTGKHPGHAYIRGNDEYGKREDVWNFEKVETDPNLEGQRPIPAETVTIGKLLQQAGYKTACVGKWGLGGPLTEGAPHLQGFDLFYGFNCQRQAHSYYPTHLWKNEQRVELNNELIVPHTSLEAGQDTLDKANYDAFNQKDYAAESMLAEALQFMDENKSQPFFLYFASPIPHLPLQAPEEYVEQYRKEWGEEPAYTGRQGYFPNYSPKATYAAMITYLDDQVGQLVAKLKALGLYENTLIIFSSDNGPTYTGGTDTPFFDSGGPFRCDYGYGKGFVQEGGIRVPMIASWPGRIAPASESDHLSAFWDVLPSLCEVAGQSIPEDTDGISFLPTLMGKNDQVKHDYLYWEFPAYGGQQAVRQGKWKAIRKDIQKGNLTIELYNLEEDIQESTDVAEENPEIVAKMEAIMEKAHVPSEVERFKLKNIDGD